MRQDDFSLCCEPNAEAMDTAHEIYAPCKDFTGNYVYHCHILDHEDMAVIQLVQVRTARRVRPDRPTLERSVSKDKSWPAF